jgi:hypothetical protein
MFDLSVVLEANDGTPVDGLVSVYTGTTPYVLTARAATLEARGFFPLEEGTALVTISGEHVFDPKLVQIPAEGSGEVTFVALPKNVTSPRGPEWCVVTGQVVDPLGRNINAQTKYALAGGGLDYRAGVVANSSAWPLSSGEVQLLRGRSYHITWYAEADEPNVWQIYVPDTAHARMYDVLFPYVTNITLLADIDGPGDYPLTCTLSDGRVLSDVPTMRRYLALTTRDAYASIEADQETGEAVIRLTWDGAEPRVTAHSYRLGATDTPGEQPFSELGPELLVIEGG